jgi:hypothetical protein
MEPTAVGMQTTVGCEMTRAIVASLLPGAILCCSLLFAAGAPNGERGEYCVADADCVDDSCDETDNLCCVHGCRQCAVGPCTACDASYFLVDDLCHPKATLGGSCDSDESCLSRFCSSQNVCCDLTCRTCASRSGVCTQCWNTATQYACGPTCATKAAVGEFCDRTAVDGVNASCQTNNCGSSGYCCNTTCADCAHGGGDSCLECSDSTGRYVEAAGRCVPKRNNGSPCLSGEECLYGMCIDDACTGEKPNGEVNGTHELEPFATPAPDETESPPPEMPVASTMSVGSFAPGRIADKFGMVAALVALWTIS